MKGDRLQWINPYKKEGCFSITVSLLLVHQCSDLFCKNQREKLRNFGLQREFCFQTELSKCPCKSNFLFAFTVSFKYRIQLFLLAMFPLSRIMRVRNNTFGNPIFQNGLQNQPSSRIMSILGCFAQLCQLSAKCKNWTFKVNFLRQKSSESF